MRFRDMTERDARDSKRAVSPQSRLPMLTLDTTVTEKVFAIALERLGLPTLDMLGFRVS